MDITWGSQLQYHAVYWPWPIAIYLFLAGLSAGSLMVAVLLKWLDKNNLPPWDGLIRAGAAIAPITIILGLVLLIVDLGKPLTFWYLMLYFKPSSVMSIGVWLLAVYTPFCLLFTMAIFKDHFFSGTLAGYIRFLQPVVTFYENNSVKIEVFLLTIASGVAIYTGFLLSAAIGLPLLNQPILPLLFLASGFSAGIAANIIIGLTVFKAVVEPKNLKYLLMLDLRVIPFELGMLFLMFAGMHFLGGAHALVGIQALTEGFWAGVFWFGVVGIGLVMPLIVAVTALHGHSYKKTTVLFNSVILLLGVLLLRFYILYAGQIYTG
ncbi:MAG: psrC [Firmicutes bacterium]|nr:psrC [Bacillota bacterium]